MVSYGPGDHGHGHGPVRARRGDAGRIRGDRAGRTIKASEFKATCLKLMDEVAKSGEEIVMRN